MKVSEMKIETERLIICVCDMEGMSSKRFEIGGI